MCRPSCASGIVVSEADCGAVGSGFESWEESKRGEKRTKKKSGENGRKEKGEETEGEDRSDGERKGLTPGLE
ncbi:hypothetical protein TNCV_2819661 [Trichonephila clavipes]|nr:hypothetical protein TNCV_2819661 [Trichonephila clavipes]